jgi:sugar lactone lactonase YvrE
VLRIDSRGQLTKSPQGAFDSPIGVAVCSAGIVVTDSKRGTLEVVDASLHPQRQIAADLQRPTGVECLGERLYVAETGRHRILVLSLSPQAASAETLEIWGTRGAAGGEFNYPTALALESDSLWVADTLNFRVQRLSPETGEYLGSWGELGDAAGEFPRIKDLAIGADGHLWISDAHLDQLTVFDRTGEFLLSIGTRGQAPGQFSFPAGLAAHPDGRIAMVDSLNRRLQIFRWTPATQLAVPAADPPTPGGRQ